MVVLSVIALLVLSGGAVAFVYYDKATQPDRRTPVLVTLEYLNAYLVDRDDAKATQYQCGDGAGLADVKALRADIDNRQKQYNVSISTSIDSAIETARSGDTAELAVDIALSTTSSGKPLHRVQRWQFTTRNRDGWRVCSGHEVTS